MKFSINNLNVTNHGRAQNFFGREGNDQELRIIKKRFT